MKQFGSEAIETPFDMPETPEGWQIALLGQIAQIVGGGTPNTSDSSNFSEGEYPWITPADLSGFNEMYISRGRRSLSEQGLKTSSALLMPKGTVLMSSRAPIGYLAIAANELCTNQGFKSFICPPGVTPEYVFFWLKFITPFLENMGSGSTFLEISGSRAHKIPILLAPTSEQKRIVAKVEELLTRVNATKDRLAKVSMILKRFRQAVLSAACSGRLTAHWRENNQKDSAEDLILKTLNRRRSQLEINGKVSLRTCYKEPIEPAYHIEFEIPDTWCLATVDQLTLLVTKGSSPKWQGFEYTEGGLPFVRSQNVLWGNLDLSDVAYLPVVFNESHKNSIIRQGDILLNLVGASVGRSSIATEAIEGANCNQAVAPVPRGRK